MNEDDVVQLVFLGEVKPPIYLRETKEPKWYLVCCGGNYHVGDEFRTSVEQQSAFMCPNSLEVYRIHPFETIDGRVVDEDLVDIDDYVFDYCQDMYDITAEKC